MAPRAATASESRRRVSRGGVASHFRIRQSARGGRAAGDGGRAARCRRGRSTPTSSASSANCRRSQSPAEMMERILAGAYGNYLESHYDHASLRKEDIRGMISFAAQYKTLEAFLADVVARRRVLRRNGRHRPGGAGVRDPLHRAPGQGTRMADRVHPVALGRPVPDRLRHQHARGRRGGAARLPRRRDAGEGRALPARPAVPAQPLRPAS